MRRRNSTACWRKGMKLLKPWKNSRAANNVRRRRNECAHEKPPVPLPHTHGRAERMVSKNIRLVVQHQKPRLDHKDRFFVLCSLAGSDRTGCTGLHEISRALLPDVLPAGRRLLFFGLQLQETLGGLR